MATTPKIPKELVNFVKKEQAQAQTLENKKLVAKAIGAKKPKAPAKSTGMKINVRPAAKQPVAPAAEEAPTPAPVLETVNPETEVATKGRLLLVSQVGHFFHAVSSILSNSFGQVAFPVPFSLTPTAPKNWESLFDCYGRNPFEFRSLFLEENPPYNTPYLQGEISFYRSLTHYLELIQARGLFGEEERKVARKTAAHFEFFSGYYGPFNIYRPQQPNQGDISIDLRNQLGNYYAFVNDSYIKPILLTKEYIHAAISLCVAFYLRMVEGQEKLQGFLGLQGIIIHPVSQYQMSTSSVLPQIQFLKQQSLVDASDTEQLLYFMEKLGEEALSLFKEIIHPSARMNKAAVYEEGYLNFGRLGLVFENVPSFGFGPSQGKLIKAMFSVFEHWHQKSVTVGSENYQPHNNARWAGTNTFHLRNGGGNWIRKQRDTFEAKGD